MKFVKCASSVVSLGLFVLASAARADWFPGEPYKYLQRPDMSNGTLATGMNVNATFFPATGAFPYKKVLADDFPCFKTEAITDLHIWGSWLNDRLPNQTAPGGPGDPSAVRFKLSIHENIAGTTNTPSHPGLQVWSQIFDPAQFTVRFEGTANERFYEPNTNQVIGFDTLVFQYNFEHLLNPFIQQGTAAAPKIYWLDVQAQPLDENAIFGWKTSLDQFAARWPNGPDDDAVYGDTTTFGGDPVDQFPGSPTDPFWSKWRDMHYPLGHPLETQSFNMAFVITPEPGSLALVAGLAGFTMMRRRRGSI